MTQDFFANSLEYKYSDFSMYIYYAENINRVKAGMYHKHTPMEIVIPLAGSFHLYINGVQHSIKNNSYVLIDHEVGHKIFDESATERSYFIIVFDILSSSGNDKTEKTDAELCYINILRILKSILGSRGFCKGDFNNNINILLEEFKKECVERRLGWESVLGMICFEIFLSIIRDSYTRMQDAQISKRQDDHSRDIATLAYEYIHEHYYEEISVEKIAASLNVSKRHINRTYEAMYGISVMKDVTRLRIEYAKKYLVETNDSLEHISGQVGFGTVNTFFKQFKNVMNITPGLYRRQNRKKEEKK